MTETSATPLPPALRSEAAAGLTEAARAQHFRLQVCQECGTVQYPPRDACAHCLGVQLPWQEVSSRATIQAATTLQHSIEAYFQVRLPWRVGTAQLACGPIALVHLQDDLQPGDQAELSLELNEAEVAVLVARPISHS